MRNIELGVQIAEEYFGKDVTTAIKTHLETIYPPFSEFLYSTFGDIYSKDTLNEKSKAIVVLSSLISQRDTKPQLALHIKASLKAGLSKEEILGVILHLVIYIGFPATINALNTAKEVFDGLNEEDI